MFMVNYEGKRHIGKKYLDLLKIEWIIIKII
jgi:hypothetical protein